MPQSFHRMLLKGYEWLGFVFHCSTGLKAFYLEAHEDHEVLGV